MTDKFEKSSEMSVKTFSFWFWLFTLVSVVVIAFYGRLTIASAHTLILALFMRQLSFVWTESEERTEILGQINELNARMDKIDPYKPD